MTQLADSNPEIETILRDNAGVTYAPRVGTDVVRGISTYQWWKCKFDRVLSLLLIVILSPVFGVITLAIKFDSRGQVFYRREQVGQNERNFIAYKFRTMQENNDDYEYKTYLTRYIKDDAPYKVDENGQSIYKVVDDPRVTKVGALLRKTNLDELPQLFNVLKGEMSIIGPRPDIPYAAAMYKPWHRKRFVVKPGITGLWQVCGRKTLPFEGMIRLDISYIKRQSLLLDAKILLLTVGTILKGDGS